MIGTESSSAEHEVAVELGNNNNNNNNNFFVF